MRFALNATGRPIAFCMCDWGSSSAWTYGRAVGDWFAACPLWHGTQNMHLYSGESSNHLSALVDARWAIRGASARTSALVGTP